jgi:hypothetical protein
MTCTEQRPGEGCRGAQGRLDDPDFLRVAFGAVARLVRAAESLNGGSLPALGTSAWFDAPWTAQAASVAAVFLGDPAEQVAAAEKAAAIAISAAVDWTEASGRPSYATLLARRAQIGAMARTVDAAAAARWASGDSRERAE